MNSPSCAHHKLLATVTVVAGGELLLVKYREMPDHQRGWFLPHDLLAHFEHPDAAVARVLRDQLGLALEGAGLAFVESFQGNDRSWHLAFHYGAEPQRLPGITPSAALAAAAWFPLAALPDRREVSHHGWALDVAAGVLARRGAAPAPAGTG